MRLLVLAVLFLITALFAKNNDEKLDSCINQTNNYLINKQYDSVDIKAKQFFKKYGKKPQMEQFVPILMESKAQQDKVNDFNKLLKTFIKKFPNSSELTRIYYLDAVLKAKRKDYLGALKSCDLGIKTESNDDNSRALILKNTNIIAKDHLSIKQLNSIKNDVTPEVAEYLNFYIAIKTKEINREEASKLLSKFATTYPTSKLDTTLVIKSTTIVKGSGIKRIAIMAPLSGPTKSLGDAALAAAKIAIANRKATTGEDIELITVDTKGNAVETAIKTKELIEAGVKVIIGPILSNTATVTAAMLIDHPEVVMVTPTATDDGIGSLGKNIFQLNLTSKAVAEKIAEYSVNTLQIKDFATIVPISDYGKTMNRYFVDAVERMGARVVVTEYFSSSANDHREQFDGLRKAYASLKFGVTDSLHQLPQSEQKDIYNYIKDSTITIGGVFIPAKSESIVKIAAEVPFYKINTQLLGTNGWDNNTLIIDGKRYVENGIFSTGSKAKKSSKEWISFSDKYKKLMGTIPTGVVAPLVFDAVNISIKALQGSNSGSDVRRKINSISGFVGLSGLLTLNNSTGVNSEAVVKKVSGGKFIRVE
jgi:ABC-type branched-subunit amino acid transport system substrate-binding protein